MRKVMMALTPTTVTKNKQENVLGGQIHARMCMVYGMKNVIYHKINCEPIGTEIQGRTNKYEWWVLDLCTDNIGKCLGQQIFKGGSNLKSQWILMVKNKGTTKTKILYKIWNYQIIYLRISLLHLHFVYGYIHTSD